MSTPEKTQATVLVVDAEASARELSLALRAAGYAAEVSSGGARARRLLREHDVAVLLCDPEAAGFDPFEEALALADPPALVQLAGFGSVEDAVAAMRRGAFDYLCKPVSEEQVLVSVSRAIGQRRLRAENRHLKERLSDRFELGNVVSRDPRLQRILQAVEALADTRATILIEGESGTGKTLLARTIHQRSTRARGPFVEVNCGALPGGLLESELFGHARGAFTGAVRDKLGKFEAADGGTIFLDEIGTASPELQVKLLRVLQDRVLERVGETKTRTIDARVIAATNTNLEKAVFEGLFRQDLYYRLRVVALEVPPLRERPGDVPLLTERFLARFAEEHGRGAKSLDEEALGALVAYRWPGNVRELEHCLERAVLLTRGDTIRTEDLALPAARAVPVLEPGAPLPSSGAPGASDAPVAEVLSVTTLRQALEGPEREIIHRALLQCGGNRKETARLLDVNRTTLFNKMRKYKLMEFPLRSEYKLGPESAGDGA
jgi:two-component system response regulator AtoC